MYLSESLKQKLKKFALPALSTYKYFRGLMSLERGITISPQTAGHIIADYTDIPSNPFLKEIKKLDCTSLDLSIIIPVYNAEKYLEKCLNSILTQDTKYSYEVICVNDGSKDNSQNILSGFRDRFGEKVVIINQKNQGISVARNTGIEAAKGAYIGFIDNDDAVSQDYVENLLHNAKKYNADIVQVGYKVVDTYNIEHMCKVKQFIATDNEILISNYCSGYIWSGIYRKTLWERVRFPVGYWYEDMITRILIMRLAKTFVMIDKPLYSKLKCNDNASTSLWNASNPKSIEAYYLAKYCSDYGSNCLELRNDRILMKQLLYEYSVQLRRRISMLPLDVQKAIFILASQDITSKFNRNIFLDQKLYSKIFKSFQSRKFNKWRYYSMALALASN